MDNNMMQMMMQMMMQNQQMMNMLMAQAMQQGTPSTPMMSTVAQSNETMSAQPSETMTAQLAELQQQVESLKNQLSTTTQELKEARQQLAMNKSTVKEARLYELSTKIEKLEKVSGKSIEEVTKSIEQGKTIVPKSGLGAHEAYKQMIDEGRLDRDTTIYADSEDVLEAIEEAKDTGKTVEEILEQAEQEGRKPKMIELTEPNEFGF